MTRLLCLLSSLLAFRAAAIKLADLSVNTPRAGFQKLADCPKEFQIYRMTHKAKGDAPPCGSSTEQTEP